MQETTTSGDSQEPESKLSLSLIMLVIVGLIVVGAVLFGITPNRDWAISRKITDLAPEIIDLEPALVNENPGFVGHQVCKECHATRVTEFEETRHHLACCTPDQQPMPKAFARKMVFSPERIKSAQFEMSGTEGRFQQRVLAEGVAKQDSPIGLIYGSQGIADEIYFSWNENRLVELPVAWLGPQQQWGLQVFADPYHHSDFSRHGTTRCLECHNTWFEYVKGTGNEYRPQSFLMGVSCERCHGPAQDHVAYHRANPAVKTAKAIVHPGKLPRDRQLDVCGQCHANAMDRYTPLFSFRPGDKLADHFRVHKDAKFDTSSVANQVGTMSKSECFVKSKMTCITCHNPHKKSKPAEVAQQSCAQCHENEQCGQHDKLPAEVRLKCVDCHMPRFNRVAVAFETEDHPYTFPMRPRQHRIGVYPAATQEVLLTWYLQRKPASANPEKVAELSSSLGEHWLRKAASYRKEYRFRATIAALREAQRFAPSAEILDQIKEASETQTRINAGYFTANSLAGKQQYAAAVEVLSDLLKLNPESARVHARLGTLFAVLGQQDRSTQHLMAVAQYDPNNPAGYNMLGWTAYLRGDHEKAIDAFRKADAIFPSTPHINFRWGLALLALQRWEEAVDQFRIVLDIDPNHSEACIACSQALRQQKKASEALPYARRADQLTGHKDIDVLVSLAETYEENYLTQKALETTRQALAIAATQRPVLAPQLRESIKRLESRTP